MNEAISRVDDDVGLSNQLMFGGARRSNDACGSGLQVLSPTGAASAASPIAMPSTSRIDEDCDYEEPSSNNSQLLLVYRDARALEITVGNMTKEWASQLTPLLSSSRHLKRLHLRLMTTATVSSSSVGGRSQHHLHRRSEDYASYVEEIVRMILNAVANNPVVRELCFYGDRWVDCISIAAIFRSSQALQHVSFHYFAGSNKLKLDDWSRRSKASDALYKSLSANTSLQSITIDACSYKIVDGLLKGSSSHPTLKSLRVSISNRGDLVCQGSLQASSGQHHPKCNRIHITWSLLSSGN